MKKREIKLPPGEAKGIGARLRERLRHRRQGQPETQDQQWLADQLDLSTAMVSRMLNHGHGSFAGWRRACQVTGASMDYVAFGLTGANKADTEFADMLNANQSMAKVISSLRAERDELMEQVKKLRTMR